MIKRTVAPAADVVSLSECKLDLRLTEANQDVHLQQIIQAATDFLDGPRGALGRPLITQTWQVTLPRLYERSRIPFAPVQSIEAIAYFDRNNTAQSFDPANYILMGDDDSAWLELASGVSLPATFDRPNAVTITLKAGYGDTPGDVPAGIRRAARIMVAHWFMNPSPVLTGSIVSEIPFSAQALMDQYRLGWVG